MGEWECITEEREEQEEKGGKGWRGEANKEKESGACSCCLQPSFPISLIWFLSFFSSQGYLHVCVLLQTQQFSFPSSVQFKSLLHFLMWQLITSCFVHFPKVLNSSLENLFPHPYQLSRQQEYYIFTCFYLKCLPPRSIKKKACYGTSHAFI